MSNSIKKVLLIVGIILLGYGIYTLITPESSVSIGDLSILETQDNTNAYITIAFGLVSLALGYLGGRK